MSAVPSTGEQLRSPWKKTELKDRYTEGEKTDKPQGKETGTNYIYLNWGNRRRDQILNNKVRSQQFSWKVQKKKKVSKNARKKA